MLSLYVSDNFSGIQVYVTISKPIFFFCALIWPFFSKKVEWKSMIFFLYLNWNFINVSSWGYDQQFLINGSGNGLMLYSPYLNQCWPSSHTNIWVTQPQSVNCLCGIDGLVTTISPLLWCWSYGSFTLIWFIQRHSWKHYSLRYWL